MSGLTGRLREIVGASAPARRVEEAPREPDGIADTLGGRWGGDRRYLVVERTYGPGHRHGRASIMDGMPPWPRLDLLGGGQALRDRLLFIDLETTGLAGGAGTYAFLIGCAWFDGPLLRIRQFFLSSYAAEPALLDGLAEAAAGIGGIVSFNGKSFDLPLIDTRYLLHRKATPFEGLPHVDLLHPARRLWRADDDEAAGTSSSCRLSVLERTVCGVAREGDVPGFEIPARYFHFVRTGDARPLAPVFEHNRLDLISLALLTARASQLLERGPCAARTPREALGLGRIYERGGLHDLACEAYARAAGLAPDRLPAPDDAARAPRTAPEMRSPLLRPADAVTRAEALRSYAILCRRQRRFSEAAEAWQRILTLRRCPAHIAREATEALAVHHEHRLRDPRAARAFALQSLRFDGSTTRQLATRHRLARLERKLGEPGADTLRF